MEPLKKYYTITITFINTNKALSIVGLNILLLLIAILIKDPFSFFADSYSKASPFFTFKEAEILKIIIQKTKIPGSEREVFRDQENWKIRSKEGKIFFADEEKINLLVKSILGAKKFTVVSSSEEKAPGFGFNEEEMKIEIFTKENSSSGFFLIGSVTPRGNYTHIKFNNSPKIYLVEDNFKSVTGRGDENFFINKRLSPAGITTDDITEFSLTILTSAKEGYGLKKVNKEWILIQPVSGNAQESEVSTILTKLQDLKADDIAESTVQLKLEKINPFTLTISYKTKTGKDGSVRITSFGKDKDYYYVKRNGDETIYKIASYQISQLLAKKAESFLNPGK